jgi:hypothetical protein
MVAVQGCDWIADCMEAPLEGAEGSVPGQSLILKKGEGTHALRQSTPGCTECARE